MTVQTGSFPPRTSPQMRPTARCGCGILYPMFASQTIRFLLATVVVAGPVQASPRPPPPPAPPAPAAAPSAVQEATQADYKHMLGLLGITEIRRGVEGR